MDLSERELVTMTRDLEQMHGDLFGGFHAALMRSADQWREQAVVEPGVLGLRTGRRGFLRAGLAGAGGLVATACGGGGNGPSVNSPAASPSGSPAISDLSVARLAASLEVLAVSTYQSVLAAATQGRLGAMPPAITTFVTTARTQHADHQSAWNSVLSGAGAAVQTAPDPRYKAIVDQALPALKDVAGAARLALQLETVALETYTAGAQLLSGAAHREVAMTIAPVEAQHVAILTFVLGSYPVPDAFVKTDMAASSSDLAGS